MSDSLDKKKAIILLSGGLDSATCCAIAKNRGFLIHAMSFSYGQRHSHELAAAEKIAQFFSVTEHRIIEINLRVFGGSSLTADIKVCLLYTSPSPRDRQKPRMPSSA